MKKAELCTASGAIVFSIIIISACPKGIVKSTKKNDAIDFHQFNFIAI